MRLIGHKLLDLRLRRGWTQEHLSERSGISVRTIRNLETGRIVIPRQSTVNLLLSVLEPLAPGESGSACGHRSLLPGAHPVHRHGLNRVSGALIGRDAEVSRLAEVVAVNRVTVLTGPGGVGKSQLARAVGEALREEFGGGTVVAELGRAPADAHRSPVSLEPTLEAITQMLEARSRRDTDRELLVLDNTEHLPATTALLAHRLLGIRPRLQLIITSRFAQVLDTAALWEVAALPAPYAAELLLRQLEANGLTASLAGDDEHAARLLLMLDGIPRLIEFAAYRLRSAPLTAFLTSACAPFSLLRMPDFSALPHQRSLEGSMRWSWELLTGRQRSLLGRLAEAPLACSGEVDALAGLLPAMERAELVSLLADLADSSMLQVHRGGAYEYRIMGHVRSFVRAVTQRADRVPLGTAMTEEIVPPARHWDIYGECRPGVCTLAEAPTLR